MTTSFEHLVIDGQSRDGTVEWLRSELPDGTWISEPDQGVYDAMNKGIRMASGRFLIFLGAGDLLLPGILAKAEQHLAATPGAKPRLLYGNVHYRSSGRMGDGRFTRSRLCTQNICHQAIFYERSIFDLLGGYELRYPIMADWALNLRLFGDARIHISYWDEVVADFEEGGLSETGRDFPFAEDRLRLIEERLGKRHAFAFRASQALQRRWHKLLDI